MKDQAVGNSRVEKGIFRSSQSEPSCFHRCKSAICNARSSAGKTCGNEQSFPAPPVFKLEMYRQGIRDSKTRHQNPLLHAGVSSKGRDSDFDRKTKRRKIPTDALPSSPSADAQQPQESEDTGTGEDGPPASSDDLFYLDDGTKDGSRVTDKKMAMETRIDLRMTSCLTNLLISWRVVMTSYSDSFHSIMSPRMWSLLFSPFSKFKSYQKIPFYALPASWNYFSLTNMKWVI